MLMMMMVIMMMMVMMMMIKIYQDGVDDGDDSDEDGDNDHHHSVDDDNDDDDDDDVRMSGTGCPHPADIGRPRPPRSILYRGRQFAFKLSHPLLPSHYASLGSISIL